MSPEDGVSIKEQLPLLVVVLGPTGSGKTALSLVLGEHFDGEIVNCDSVALYREFQIGTAKPSLKERARVPHHLFDFVSPTEEITAGEYARMARETLRQINARKKLPIVAGGTGLYLRALLEGLFAGPQRSEDLRKRLRQLEDDRGRGHLHRLLQRLDSEAAKKIHANDAPKLIRAIEVCLSSKQRITSLWQRGRDPLLRFCILRIGLDPKRELLYARINERAQRMFESGLLEETAGLLQRYGDAAKPLISMGYKQAVQALRGEVSRESAISTAQQAHRNYAKRQMTWFRREPDVHWLRGFGDDATIQRESIALVRTAVVANHIDEHRATPNQRTSRS